MRAFHSDPAIKAKYVDRIAAHRAGGTLLKGVGYWTDGKGNATGCAIRGSNHALFETELGIPQMLARMQDTIFEGLPADQAQLWPSRFLAAVEPGADLTAVGWRLIYWLLTDPSVNPAITAPSVNEAMQQCAAVVAPLCGAGSADRKAALAAQEAAIQAAWAVQYRTYIAQKSAALSAKAAMNAALMQSQPGMAAGAASSVLWNAAEGAGYSAPGERSRPDIREAAVHAAWGKMADKLIDLTKGGV